jgi:hypothetical protein
MASSTSMAKGPSFRPSKATASCSTKATCRRPDQLTCGSGMRECTRNGICARPAEECPCRVSSRRSYMLIALCTCLNPTVGEGKGGGKGEEVTHKGQRPLYRGNKSKHMYNQRCIKSSIVHFRRCCVNLVMPRGKNQKARALDRAKGGIYTILLLID